VTLAQSQTQSTVSIGIAGPGGTEGWAALGSVSRERVSWQGISFGAEAALIRGRTGPRPGRLTGGAFEQFLGSLYGSLHRLSVGGVEPFAGAGISLVTDPDCCGPGVGWNLRGGTIVWLSRKFGFKVEGQMIRPFGGEGGLLVVAAGGVYRVRAR